MQEVSEIWEDIRGCIPKMVEVCKGVVPKMVESILGKEPGIEQKE